MNIAVIGAGNLGTRIAQIAVLAGYNVALYDISPQVTQRAQIHISRILEVMVNAGKLELEEATRIRSRVSGTTVLERCAEADIILECVPEQLDLKTSIFERIDAAASEQKVLVTCTAMLPVTVMAAAAKNFPERVIGAKFSTPVVTARLVEVIRTMHTATHAIDRTIAFGQALGKKTVLVKDTPGFLVDRIRDAYTHEALHLLEEGHVDFEAIDRLMETLDFRFGPFRLMDEEGLDNSLAIKETLYNATGEDLRFRPHLILRRMVQAGLLGRKTGQGFHRYDGQTDE